MHAKSHRSVTEMRTLRGGGPALSALRRGTPAIGSLRRGTTLSGTLATMAHPPATGGIKVFDKAGQSLGTITLPAGNPSNCTFGGPDKQTLFITSNAGGGNAATGLYSIHLNVPGLP